MPVVSAAIKKELFALDRHNLEVPFLVSKMSKTTSAIKDEDGKRKFVVKPAEWDSQAKMHLDAGEYTNKEAVDTTLGRFLANKMLFEGNIDKILPNGYCNDVLTSKAMKKIFNLVSTEMMAGRLPIDPNVTKMLQAYEFYGLMLVGAMSPSLTSGIMTVDERVRKRRDELFAAAGGEDNVSVEEAVRIEDELTAYAKELLKDDPGMILFNSGARGSFDDNYKVMSVMVGPGKNVATGEYEVIKNNLVDGIDKKDIPKMANVAVNATYPKSVGTAEGGYITKQFYAVFQSIRLGEKDSDCGSKGYMDIYLTEDIYADYVWQYAVGKNGSLTLMTNENKDKFINKNVKLRSPIGCLSPAICNKCMGERFYILGIENAGLTSGRLPNSILNAGMKQFHVTKLHFNKVDPEALIIR